MAQSTLTHTAPQARDFTAAERKALLIQGIAIVGVQMLDNERMGYSVNDNGTHRLRTRLGVAAMARELTASEQRMLVCGA